MVVAALLWSGAFLTGQYAVAQLPPFTLSFFRFLFALPLIFFIFARRERGNLWPCRQQWGPLFLLGLTGIFAYHAFFFYSLRYTTAVNSALLGATNPIMTAILGALFFREGISLLRRLGIGLSFAGVFVVITQGNWGVVQSLQLNPGDLLMLAGIFVWAIFALLSRVFMHRYNISPLMLTSYCFAISVVISIPFVLLERPWEAIATAGWAAWLSVLYMSIFASVLTYIIHTRAVRHIGAPRAAMFFNLVPIFTIIQSILILGKPLALAQLVGATVIIAGVYLASRPDALALK